MIIDHNVYLGNRSTPGLKASKGTKIIKSYGGAGLLYNIADEGIKTRALNSKNKKAESGEDEKEIPAIYRVQFGFKIKDYCLMND